jgi:GT2 family glycosyltransferase
LDDNRAPPLANRCSDGTLGRIEPRNRNFAERTSLPSQQHDSNFAAGPVDDPVTSPQGGDGPSPELCVPERMITIEDLPVARTEIELSAPPAKLQLINAGQAPHKIVALVRLHSHPLGTMVLDGTLGAWKSHAPTVWSAMREAINVHLAHDGLAPVDDVDDLRAAPPAVPGCVRRRQAVLASAPGITVVIGTRERPEQLRICLEALLALDYPHFEVVVVDNAPTTEDTAKLIADSFPVVRYVREDRQGLASAHNRGLREVETGLVAFVDDDVLVDRHWLTAIAEGFAADADVGCVTGLILPAELDTPAQLLLQRHGGYDKGFGLRVYDMDQNRPADPLFPFSAGRLGSGANMAFDMNVLRELGGFDAAMGIGTSARGGDDLVAFFRVVLRHRLVYQPAAVVWHRHHRDMAALRNQAFGYGVGLGAFLTAVMMREPSMWGALLRRLPAGLAFAFSPSSTRNRSRYDGLPMDMARREKLGLLSGPTYYAVSRWRKYRGAPG